MWRPSARQRTVDVRLIGSTTSTATCSRRPARPAGSRSTTGPPSTPAAPRSRDPRQAAAGRGAATRSCVSAGDNIGASPLPSALFHDEPTIDFLNAIGRRRLGRRQPRVRRGLQGAAAHAVRRLPPDRRLPVPADVTPAPTSRSSAPTSPSTNGRPAAAAVHDQGLRRHPDRRHRRRPCEDLPTSSRPSRDRGPEVRRRGRRRSTGPRSCSTGSASAARSCVHAPGRRRPRGGPNACNVVPAGPAPRSPRRPARASTRSSPATATSSTTARCPTRRATRAR